jgi:peptidoglycan/xylan/chitin deacetylase (PgdA/CDA1 family)
MSAVVRNRTLVGLACAGVVLAGCAAGPSEGSQAVPSAAPSHLRVTPAAAPTTADPPAAPHARPTAAIALPTVDSSSSAPSLACTVPPRFAGRELERLPVKAKVIALTFDAGANADGVPSIRATLKRLRVKATFFLTGSFVQHFPVKSRRLASRDLIGNHTMTHPDLTTLSDHAVIRQVRDAEAVIRSTTGQDPRRFFRFPFGARNAHLIGLLNQLCYVPFRWTVDSLGWKGTSGGQSVASVVSRVVGAAEPGAIVLMHVGSNPDDGTTLDADALPTIITDLRAQGYGFVRLARVMRASP